MTETKQETGQRLDARIVEVRAQAAVVRVERAARWKAAWQEERTAWRERHGYKHAPIMNGYEVKREVHDMLRIVIEGRLMQLLTPLLVTAEHVERSILIISMLARPSGNGPERYAPKPGMPERISVR